MDRAQRFIQLYNQLSRYLRERVNADVNVPFYQMIRMVAPTHATVRRYATEIKEYGDLRNTIVHYEDYPQGIIAEPTEQTITRFTRIVENIVSPRHLIPAFEKVIHSFDSNESLATVLTYMSEHDFSQVVTRQGGVLSLLTVEGITMWLAREQRSSINLTQVRLSDALIHDHPDNYLFMSRNDSVDDAHQAFVEALSSKHPRLLAIIVTNSGKDTEQPLGLVTPWDLLEEDT